MDSNCGIFKEQLPKSKINFGMIILIYLIMLFLHFKMWLLKKNGILFIIDMNQHAQC